MNVCANMNMQGRFEPVFVENFGNLSVTRQKKSDLKEKMKKEEAEWGKIYGRNNKILPVNLK